MRGLALAEIRMPAFPADIPFLPFLRREKLQAVLLIGKGGGELFQVHEGEVTVHEVRLLNIFDKIIKISDIYAIYSEKSFIFAEKFFIRMKKLILFSLLLGGFAVFSCSGTSGENSGSTVSSAGDEGKVVHLDAAQFRKVVWDYSKDSQNWKYEGSLPCIIDFYADWCRPCKMVAPIMDQLAEEYKGKVIIYKVNTDEQRELSSIFNIRSIPAVLYVPQNGKPQMFVGAMGKADYVESIKSVLQVK